MLANICLPLATLPSPSPPRRPVQVPDPKISARPWAPQLEMAPQWIDPLLLPGPVEWVQGPDKAFAAEAPGCNPASPSLAQWPPEKPPLSLCLPWGAVWWVLPPLLLRLVPWFGLGVLSRVGSDQAGQPLCLGRVPMSWQPRVLAIDGKRSPARFFWELGQDSTTGGGDGRQGTLGSCLLWQGRTRQPVLVLTSDPALYEWV